MARRSTRNDAPSTIDVDARIAAAAAGDLATAVGVLVEVWRACSSSRIAAVVSALSARLPAEALPAKVEARDARWIELASTGDRAQLPSQPRVRDPKLF